MIAKIRRADNGYIVTTYHKSGDLLLERENVFYDIWSAMIRVAIAMGKEDDNDPQIGKVIRVLRGEAMRPQ